MEVPSLLGRFSANLRSRDWVKAPSTLTVILVLGLGLGFGIILYFVIDT